MRQLLRRDVLVILGSMVALGAVLHISFGVISPDSKFGTRFQLFHGGQCPPSATQQSSDGRMISSLVALDDKVQTSILRHVPGFTIFDGLFMLNGTLYVVSEKPDEIPPLRMMTSSGYPVFNGEEEIAKREPTSEHIQIITPVDAVARFGSHVTPITGVTLLLNDPPQFINHYYHFVAELLVGLWRTYSSLDMNITPAGETSLPAPSRFISTHTPSEKWHDYSGLDQFILRSAFPAIGFEYKQDWLDRSQTLRPFRFDRVVLADRAAAMRSPNFAPAERYASSAFTIEASQHWWRPVRENVLLSSRATEGTYNRVSEKPVITYISRQAWGSRCLKSKDHNGLVKALKALEKKHGWEVNIVAMESMNHDEQIRLVARSTIVMGVHGNGLSSLIWMQPTSRSAVFEFFIPGGFTTDYQWTAGAMGINYFGFWDSKYFTTSGLPPKAFPEGFQGNEIPIHGDIVASLCEKVLTG